MNRHQLTKSRESRALLLRRGNSQTASVLRRTRPSPHTLDSLHRRIVHLEIRPNLTDCPSEQDRYLQHSGRRLRPRLVDHLRWRVTMTLAH